MLDAKQAVSNTFQSLRELDAPEKVNKILLDEIQLSDGGQFWLVTLTFPPEIDSDGLDSSPAKSQKSRPTKVVKIHADNGRFMALTQPKK